MVLPVSVVIPSRNRAQFLVDSVMSILDGADVPCELLIVDQSDARNEQLVALGNQVRGCRLQYIWPQRPGVSRARNNGALLAGQRQVAFVDDDVLVRPTWLVALCDAFLGGDDRTVVSGQVQASPPE